MLKNMADINERPQQDLFRNLVSSSKIVFLCRAIDQYEQAQAQLRQNEDHQQRMKQFQEYNRVKLLELDLARQRILQSNNIITADRMNRNGFIPHIIPIPQRAQRPQGVMKPRANTKISLPLQRSSQPMEIEMKPVETIKRKTYKERMESSATQSDCIEPVSTHDFSSSQKNENYGMSSRDSLSRGEDDDDGDDDDDSNRSSCAEDFPEQTTKRPKIKVPRRRDSSCFKDADVLFERGNFTYNHPGNKVYREHVKTLQDEYVRCRKNDKVSVATKVLNFIKNTCGGRFMACDKEGSGDWEELSDEAARRKIGQSLREKNKRYMPPPRSRKNSKRILT